MGGAPGSSPSVQGIEDFLYGLRARGVRPGLEPTRAALDELGAPDESLLAIQVAGSVGKGSTSAMLAAALCEAGLRTALFTSPHLVRFGERFVIDGVEATREDLDRKLHRLREALPWAVDPRSPPPVPEARPLTFFEWATVLACFLFKEARADIAVLEVGLGGRWDATTACKADVTAIGRIDLEHTEILGDTLAKIAFEKAGVMRAGVPAVTVAQAPEALEVLRRRAAEIGTTLLVKGKDFDAIEAPGGDSFDYQGPLFSIPNLSIGLEGRHQVENAALAVAALEALAERMPHLEARLRGAIPQGLSKARIHGRVERVAPGLWLDGSHTRASIGALTEVIADKLPGGRAHLVFAVLMEKPASALLELLRPVAASLTLTSAGADRAVDPASLKPLVAGWSVPVRYQPDPMKALEAARGLAGEEHVVACGSLYLIGALRAGLQGVAPDPGDPSVLTKPSSGA